MSSQTHTIAPGQETLQLEIPVVLPGVDDAQDGCIERLQNRLSAQTGIDMAHIDMGHGKPQLCLHYNPNLVTLEKLERLARDEGAAITQRFKHETLPIAGMDCASCAAGIEQIVGKAQGVTHVNVNYPTGKMKVEYDSTLIDRAQIVKTIGKLGYRVPSQNTVALTIAPREHDHSAHDHEGHDHSEHDHSAHDAAERDEHEGHAHDAPAGGGWWARNRELGMAGLLAGVLLIVGFCQRPRFESAVWRRADFLSRRVCGGRL